MARPVRRNKKAVDYSQFVDTDDDDEDFATISAPSNKKSKRVNSESAKEKTEQRTKAHNEGSQLPKRSPIKRVALDDKLYQRDLEVALALSVNESSPGSSHKMKDLEEQAEELQSNSSFTDDDEEDDDDEFVAKKKTKENKNQGRKLNENKMKKPSKSTRKLIVQAESQPTLQNTLCFPELIEKPLKPSSPSATKKPNWTPPGASGSDSNQPRRVPGKSPSQSLRLGLSRLAKVKPLHQSLVSS